MSDITLTPSDIAKLRGLATVLIPGTDAMPSIDELQTFDALLQTSVKACGYSDDNIRRALDAIAPEMDWAAAKALRSDMPESFEALSVFVSASYYMAPEVLGRLKFPIDRRHPAGPEDFLEEFETGILEPVMERGPRFRDTRTSSQ